jgi:hypothetical protein
MHFRQLTNGWLGRIFTSATLIGATATGLPGLGATPTLAAPPTLATTSTISATGSPALDADISAAMALLNDIRSKAGVGPVSVDSQLSAATQAHAAYLVANSGKPQLEGLNAHDEDLSLPGATKAGREAGLESDIARGPASVVDSMVGLLAAPLHQRWLLEPSLKRVGMGVATYSTGGLAVVIDVGHGLERPTLSGKPVVYPAPDQTGVPTRFFTETPDPRQATPAGAGGLTGPAITVNPTCGDLQPPARVVLRTQDGRDVPAWTVNPGSKLTAVGGERTVEQLIILPQHELEPGTSYHVEVDDACIGPKDRTQNHMAWSFTTVGSAPRRAMQQPIPAEQPTQPSPQPQPGQGEQPVPQPQKAAVVANPGMDPALLRSLFVLDHVHGELADYVGGPFFASAYLANNGWAEGWGDPGRVGVEDGAWVLHFSNGVTLRARTGEQVSVTRLMTVTNDPTAQDAPPLNGSDDEA